MEQQLTRVARRQQRGAKPQSPSLKAFLDSAKRETRLLGAVERHLLGRAPEDRDLSVLHPSELAKPEVCARALYMRMVWAREGRDLPREVLRLRTLTIFGEGNAIHEKWQGWLAEMGVLRGMWECPCCSHRWLETVPVTCPQCNYVGQRDGYSATNMRYREVPLRSSKHNIAGLSDGWIDDGKPDALLEVKSIGKGTVRIEAPHMFSKHGGDMEKMWADIRRPFPSHLRQGHLYLALAELDLKAPPRRQIAFIYENKADQAFKEFLVTHDPEVSGPLLELALDVMWAVEKGREPDCVKDGCANCKLYEEAA